MTAAGIQQQAWAKIETAFDTPEAIAGADGFDFNTMTIGGAREFSQITAHVGTASLQGEVPGKIENSFTCECDLMPAAAGVAPDIGPFLQSVFGQAPTVVGSTSVTYQFSDGEEIPTLQVVRKTGAELCEWVYGLAVQTLTIVANDAEKVMATIEGVFASYGFLYGAPVTSAEAASGQGVLELSADDIRKVGKGARLAFGAEDNSGDGYEVTAVDHDAGEITVSPNLAATVASGTAITAAVPTHAVNGRRIGGVDHDLQLDSVSIGLQSTEIQITTGNTPIDNEANRDSISGWYRGRREVSITPQLYLRDENAGIAGSRFDDRTVAVALRLGPDIAARRAKINAPACRFQVEEIEVPDAELATYSAAGVCRQGSVAGDELELVFD